MESLEFQKNLPQDQLQEWINFVLPQSHKMLKFHIEKLNHDLTPRVHIFQMLSKSEA